MGRKMAVGNICHIKMLKRIFVALIVFLCFSYYGAAQKDSLPLFYFSGALRQCTDTTCAQKDTNKCMLIHFNKRAKQFKISHINKKELGLYLHAEYNVDSLLGMAIEGYCTCFLFGDNCPMFHKIKEEMFLPAFFYEQLQYKDHRLIDLSSTEPPIFPCYFVKFFQKKGNKLIFLHEKAIYIDKDYFIFTSGNN